LGAPHPRYLYQYLSSRDIAEWMAYERLEPFGPLRDDVRSGTLAAVLTSALTGEKYSPDDFYPSLREPEEPMSVEMQLHLVEMLHAAYGGKIKRD